MLENKWNNIAPEVPQDFHEKFEETLRHIEQADAVNKKYKRKRISGRLLIAAAVICTGMGVTVAAKEFFKWNDHLLKRLEPSEEQQETMQESNYIQNIDQSVTQNGVTVTLTDSIQDQGFLYAFFEVKTEDSISMTDHTSFEEMTHFKIDGKEVYAVDDNRFGSFNTGVGQDVLLKTAQNSAHLPVIQNIMFLSPFCTSRYMYITALARKYSIIKKKLYLWSINYETHHTSHPPYWRQGSRISVKKRLDADRISRTHAGCRLRP